MPRSAWVCRARSASVWLRVDAEDGWELLARPQQQQILATPQQLRGCTTATPLKTLHALGQVREAQERETSRRVARARDLSSSPSTARDATAPDPITYSTQSHTCGKCSEVARCQQGAYTRGCLQGAYTRSSQYLLQLAIPPAGCSSYSSGAAPIARVQLL